MFNNVFYEENKINLTGYLEIPKEYVDRKTGQIRETCYFRNLKFMNIRNGIVESPYEEEFYSKYPHFDREIIIFIENRKYWRFLLRSVGIKDKDLYNKNFFSLDFFDPRVSLNVEIDSIQYHPNKDLDFVRDKYLYDIFGINVIRIYGVILADNYERIDNYYKRNDLTPINSHSFRFKEVSSDLFEKKHELDIKLLNALLEFPLYNRNFLRRGIIFTQKDIKELGTSEKVMSKFIIFLKKYYNQDVSIIRESSQYTAKEAFTVLSQNSTLILGDLWGQELLSVFEGKDIAGKYGTRDFIDTLENYGYTWEIIVNSIT